MHYTITNSKTKDKIYVNLDVPILSANNRTVDTLDIRDIELFCLIVDASPKALRYDDIITKLLKKYDISCDYSDPILYIRKKKHKILKCIQFTLGDKSLPTLFDTIRGVGYRLNVSWEKEDSPVNLGQLIDAIGRILEETITLEEGIPLCNMEAEGGEIIVLNANGFSKQISTLQRKYIKLAGELLNSLNLSPFENKYVLVESMLHLIRSYTAMSRQGTGISHEEWRTMFKDELRHHFRSLVMLVQA